jgi:hypothetical protein
LEKDNEQLKKVGVETGSLPDALEARADFYMACIKDTDVKSVGFTPEHDFPVPRSTFPERAKKPPPKEKDETDWVITIEEIFVTSPNWKQDDQRARKWKGEDQSRRDCYFVIEDAEFWRLARLKSLKTEVVDRLKVQWAHPASGGRVKDRRVLRVLEFNGERLSEPLSPDAIRAILGSYSTTCPNDEPSLFG